MEMGQVWQPNLEGEAREASVSLNEESRMWQRHLLVERGGEGKGGEKESQPP
jgi:hypothetical protein